MDSIRYPKRSDSPGDIMTHEKEGWRLKKEGKISEAINEFDEAVNENDNIYFALHGKGECLLECGQPDEALKCFCRAVKVDRSHSWAYHGCGRCYFMMGEYEAAEESFLKSLRRNRRSSLAWLGLGKCCFRENRFTEAEADFRNALSSAVSRHPELVPEISRMIGLCRENGYAAEKILSGAEKSGEEYEEEIRFLKDRISQLEEDNRRLKAENKALEILCGKPLTINAGGNINIGGSQANDAGIIDNSASEQSPDHL